jgi:hypothetical protein
VKRLLALALLSGCGAPHATGPLPVRAYHVLVRGRDSLSDALAETLKARGVAVERHVTGGGPRAAAVIMFTYRDPASERWFALRLADTRSGAVVAQVTLPADSLGNPLHAARLLVDSLLARPVSASP